MDRILDLRLYFLIGFLCYLDWATDLGLDQTSDSALESDLELDWASDSRLNFRSWIGLSFR